MAKRRYPLVSKLKTYEEAKLIKDNMMADPGGPHREGEIQIRKYSGGYKVVLRSEHKLREVTK